MGLKLTLSEAFPGALFGEAASVAEARTLIAQQQWNLLLLDISLHGGPSGLDLLAELRSQGMGLAILMLSVHSEEEYALSAIKGGADGFLNKTSATGEIIAAVRKVLAGGKHVSSAIGEKLARVISEPQAQLPHETLTPREMDVLQGVALGKTIKGIASELLLSEKTVATHRKRLADKLKLSTNVDLARYALQQGLVD
jgi:DNA-binding NarL/FixJ family response regulator